ncbi:MAG TPA: helix-turn-helix transcriptional regulator [Terricaulis sp.]|nr:helix-turn-helix transcriptional regulator [Terricaulis sp.]
MTLPKRIQHRLTVLGLKMGQASRDAGLGATYVRDLIKGRVLNPRAEHIAKLALTLKTTPEWLTHERGPEEPGAEAHERERIQRMLARIAAEDLPHAERALRGYLRDEPQRDETSKEKAKRKPKRA